MSVTHQVDVQQLIDTGRFSRYQFLIAFLCFIIIFSIRTTKWDTKQWHIIISR